VNKYKVGCKVKITHATGFRDSLDGDLATVTVVLDFMDDSCFAKLDKNGEELHLCDLQAIVIGYPTPNRDYLRDFVKMNNIKTTLVSKALGKSQNWLTQMMNDKRRDMTDATLKDILKKLHIDWASQEWLHVKDEVPYRTKPCNYTTVQHKERLQLSMWRGLVTKA